MTLFFTITLYVSATGLVLLLGLKRYEMRTGRVIFARARPRLERMSHALVLFVQYILPFVARRGLAAMFGGMRQTLSATLARVTLYVESTLAHLLLTMQHAMQPRRSSGTASTFLQEVADHKRRLLRTPAEKRAIFEEYQQ